ncbi:hypothetical protein FW778_21535 [Ginsengibacter hankyongi]|uniref:Uncharacterized protein n=1 Tax=Ginsengibacter hankyongi TaxID=2607284 RepID=A0A5J5IC17_9BACT|nr:hypothetical protein [Ginsengibacter hankyongi]KAA9035542.1 hypothetical protein FW778_21535 [Ginsengibacter hankyongi]
MPKLAFLLLVFYSKIISAQTNKESEQALKQMIDSLNHNEAVDTFLNYSLTCIGGMRLDTCNYYDAEYLFWIEGEKTFLKKFDGCGFYKSLPLDSIDPLTFYLTHKNQIDKEQIKPPTYIQSKKGNVVTEISSTIDHTCYYEMTFIINGDKVFKRVSDYDLNFIRFDNGKKNIYYNYNRQTKLKSLIDKIDELLKHKYGKPKDVQ